MTQALEFSCFRFFSKASVHLRERERKQINSRKLRCERFRRGHPDFNAGTRDVCKTAFPNHCGGRNIADRERALHAKVISGVTQRCNRICSFA